MNKRKTYQVPESIVIMYQTDMNIMQFSTGTQNPGNGGDPTNPGGGDNGDNTDPFDDFWE